MKSSADSDYSDEDASARPSTRRAQPRPKETATKSTKAPPQPSRKFAKMTNYQSDSEDEETRDSAKMVTESDEDIDSVSEEPLRNGKTASSSSSSSSASASSSSLQQKEGKVPTLRVKKIDNEYKSLIDDKTVSLAKSQNKRKQGKQVKKSAHANGYTEDTDEETTMDTKPANGHSASSDKKASAKIAKSKKKEKVDSDVSLDDDSDLEIISAKIPKSEKKEKVDSDASLDDDSELEITSVKIKRKKKKDDSDVSVEDLDAESSGTDGYKSLSANSDFEDELEALKPKNGKGKGKKKDVSSEEDSDIEVKPKTKRRTRRKKASDSANEDEEDEPKKKGKRGKGKRRRIKKASSSEAEPLSGSDDGKTRKKIRRIIKDKKLSVDVKTAVKAEEERRERVKERQQLYNQVTEVDINSPLKTSITTKLVLDVDENKEPLIEVHPKLIRKLKPHQVEAVKFVWDCTVESLERMKEDEGAGCILAHCMGLGKTLSLITFAHTLLYNSDVTDMKTCLIVCPLNTVLNWRNEWQKWCDDDLELDVYELASIKDNNSRARELEHWHKNGGIMIVGYEMYRNLVLQKNMKKKKMKEVLTKALSNPGPDLVVCDEGHMLKNSATSTSKAMSMIRTKRRVVLTGTPLQNNLAEYHCMVDFVKPKLLGTKKEFLNRFVNPILNGQCADSSAHDVHIMKKRAHVLHETLAGCVQRKDYTELTKVLMPLHEYILAVRLSEVQMNLYDKYMELREEEGQKGGKGAQLFSDYQALMRIWTHPWVLKLDEIRQEHKRAMNGEFDDFIEDEEAEEAEDHASFLCTSSSEEVLSLDDSDTDSDEKNKKKRKNRKKSKKSDSDSDEKDSAKVKKCRGTKRTRKMRGEASEESDTTIEEEEEDKKLTSEWWGDFVTDEDKFKVELSGKLMLLAEILRMCENIGDKVLVFSQSLLSLDLIESFLEYWDSESDPDKRVAGQHRWVKNWDYFRMDGSTGAQARASWCDEFNDDENHRGRLFLISTRAGSLGTNLVAANRVIVFDASWNPSHDIQSIFRVYRFGQMKPCYIYRFLAQGTMEEKIYERQVTKQSLSQRVVDEHQIERHFTAQDLQELYKFQPLRWTKENEEREKPALPKDRLLAELLTDKKEWIVKYHNHDSLLENKVDQDLTEDERKAAWEEYEAEKKGAVTIARNTYSSYNQQLAQQQQQQQWMQYYGAQQAAYQAPMQQPSMSLGSIEQVARAIYAANQGITQVELQQKVQEYIEMVTKQQQYWYQQQQQAAMQAGFAGGAQAMAGASGLPGISANPGSATAVKSEAAGSAIKPKPSTSSAVIDLADSDEEVEEVKKVEEKKVEEKKVVEKKKEVKKKKKKGSDSDSDYNP